MAGRRWLLYPFLAALYFVLTLAASNAVALNGLGDLAWPISVSLLVCGLLWTVGYALTRDARKASLLSLLWLVAFSLFGYVADALRPAGALTFLGGELGLSGLFAIAVFGPSLAIRRTVRRLDPLGRYLTLVGVLLVAFTTVQLYRGLRQERDLRAFVPPPSVLNDRTKSGDPPDIYLIILDKYTGSEILARNFGFDNSEFETLLRDRGFVVPKHSRANYPQTQLALAAMLNLDYVHNLPRQFHLYDLIENNRLAAFLKLQGYRFVFFPTPFKFTYQNRNADLQLPSPKVVRGEFGAVWQQTTLLPELLSAGCAVIGCRTGRFRYIAEAADFMDWKFERLKDLSGGEPPTFVLAHLSLPHEPYLYNADCTHREPYWPVAAGMLGDEKATKGYLDQISCVNRKVAALVDSILTRSRRPPVILIQADHGHGRLGRLPEYEKVSAYQLRERMSAFSAYLLPGVGAGGVGDSITPVSAMRLVLRHYFGADLPPMEDASYWSTEERPFEFVRIE
ncbi:MAG: hypothetical protein ACREA0_08485 [bacterium]